MLAPRIWQRGALKRTSFRVELTERTSRAYPPIVTLLAADLITRAVSQHVRIRVRSLRECQASLLASNACLEDQFQRLGIRALAAYQLTREAVQQASVLTQDRCGAPKRRSQQPVDFVVDHLADVFGVVALFADIPAQKDHLLFATKRDRP